jgi:hypothetical protein
MARGQLLTTAGGAMAVPRRAVIALIPREMVPRTKITLSRVLAAQTDVIVQRVPAGGIPSLSNGFLLLAVKTR